MTDNRSDELRYVDAAFATASLLTMQNKVGAQDREVIAGAIASEANRVVDNPYKGDEHRDLVLALRKDGIVTSPFKVPKAACEDVVRYFSETPCYNGHVAAYSDGVGRLPRDTAPISNYGSYTLDQCLKAPHLLEFALNEAILDIVGGYLGCLPTLYSVNTFWTFPRPNAGGTHDFHRDEDDYRFLAVFVYWTDVTAGEGEFYFIPRTHDWRQMNPFIAKKRRTVLGRAVTLRGVRNFDQFRNMKRSNGYGHGWLYRTLFSKDIQMFDGEAGTGFISDTFGLHRGSPPGSRPRLTTWFRYGLYANEAYHTDKTTPVRAEDLQGKIALDERNRFICRLIIKN